MQHDLNEQLKRPRPRRKRLRFVAICLLSASLVFLVMSQVHAAPRSKRTRNRTYVPRTEGMLLAIEDSEYVIDLGRRDGLRPGTRVRLFRTIRIKHPVTGKAVRDRFAIGAAHVSEVSERMAVLQPAPEQQARLRVGDPVVVVVVVAVAKPVRTRKASGRVAGATKNAGNARNTRGLGALVAERPGPASATPLRCPPAKIQVVRGQGVDPRGPDARAAEMSFLAAMGRQPTERIRIWRSWLRRFPASSLAVGVRREIDALHEMSRASRLAQVDRRRASVALKRAQTLRHVPVPSLYVGEPAWVVVTAGSWVGVADVRVYYRVAGGGAYTMVRPKNAGRLHRRALMPASVVAAPGFDYFVVFSTPNGKVRSVVGDPSEPVHVVVRDLTKVGSTRRPGASTVRWITELADYNRMRGDDRVLMAELDVTYRLQWRSLYAFNLGYGFFNGVGGRVADSDGPNHRKGDTLDARAASFKYAWLAFEWAHGRNWHTITKLLVGLESDGIDTGLELITRIGPERGTHLKLGVSTLGDLGRAAQVALTTHAVASIPMTGIFEVTNRPVGEDLGIRLIYQADFSLNQYVAITGRVGYALRTIDHAGLSLGGGMALNW